MDSMMLAASTINDTTHAFSSKHRQPVFCSHHLRKPNPQQLFFLPCSAVTWQHWHSFWVKKAPKVSVANLGEFTKKRHLKLTAQGNTYLLNTLVG